MDCGKPVDCLQIFNKNLKKWFWFLVLGDFYEVSVLLGLLWFFDSDWHVYNFYTQFIQYKLLQFIVGRTKTNC